MNDTSETENSSNSPQKPLLNSFKGILTRFSPKEQMEMSIICLAGMIILLTITTIYLGFFRDFTTFFRVLIVLNGIFGIGFLFSLLLTTYSQYITLLTVGNIQEMSDSIKAIGDLVS